MRLWTSSLEELESWKSFQWKTSNRAWQWWGRGGEGEVALRKRDPWRLTKHKTSPAQRGEWQEASHGCNPLGRGSAAKVRQYYQVKAERSRGAVATVFLLWFTRMLVWEIGVKQRVCFCHTVLYASEVDGSNEGRQQRYWSHCVSINSLFFPGEGGVGTRDRGGEVMTKPVEWWAVDALHQPLKMNNSAADKKTCSAQDHKGVSPFILHLPWISAVGATEACTLPVGTHSLQLYLQ